ncbi:hypothetical protein [Candidatus Binatus soli]|jgi:hypothetical protein
MTERIAKEGSGGPYFFLGFFPVPAAGVAVAVAVAVAGGVG